ncbi:MAG: hypothetical protein ACLTS6_11405 [Anaerobutyricum sp.]
MNNTVTNQIDVTSIFEKVKTLSDDDKMLLRRAWKIPFNRLRMPQKALLFSSSKMTISQFIKWIFYQI